jgi:transketolase
MRVEFCASIHTHLVENHKSVLLTGDLGFGAFEKIQKDLGPRFINAGVAEQNMISVAAGMASTGLEPWVYSITPFLILRTLEQIRNDVCFHALPVRLVGNGGGYTYGANGPSHHALEDLAVLKALPGINLFFPCMGDQVAAAVALMSELRAPSYLRLAVAAWPPAPRPFEENRKTLTRRYSNGKELTVIGVGHATQHLLKAFEEGPATFDKCSLFSISRYPFDFESDHALVKSIEQTGRVFIVEEHYQAGSISESLHFELGSKITELHALMPSFHKSHRCGSNKFYLQAAQMSPSHIASRLKEFTT